MSINIFWFRRDLRLADNHALYQALESEKPVQPLFIFDTNILNKLKSDDRRVKFIHDQIIVLNNELNRYNGSLMIRVGDPYEVFEKLLEDIDIVDVYANEDYEPYALKRDKAIHELLLKKRKNLLLFKDQLIFHPDEILKTDGSPYEIFTPFSKRWKQSLKENSTDEYPSLKHLENIRETENSKIPTLQELGFKDTNAIFPTKEPPVAIIRNYAETRNLPSVKGTTQIGIHIRFGTVSIRECVRLAIQHSEVWLNELIWREFFTQMIFHYPHLTNKCYKKKYDRITWRNNEEEFERWKSGTTGYPLVDAGMHELSETGFMHNRVRMVTASFLVKHLLIDWRWGEAWFAEKLLDYDLAINVGNWQWVAGCGCDAAPYFRIFNPITQQLKFDPDNQYIKTWITEYGTNAYPEPIIDHQFARIRCLEAYKIAIE